MTSTSLHYATVWEAMADHIPDAPALRHGARVRSWAEFEARSARLAGALQAHGIGRDDGVASYLYNGPEYFEAFFGPLKLRAVPCNINYRYGSNELVALLENSEAKVLFFDAALRENVAAIADHVPDVRLFVEIGGESESPGSRRVRVRGLALERATGAAHRPRRRRRVPVVHGWHDGAPEGRAHGHRTERGQLPVVPRPLPRARRATARGRVRSTPRRARHTDERHPGFAAHAQHRLHLRRSPTLFAGGTVTTLEHQSFDAHELLAAVEATSVQVVAIVGDAFALPIVRALDDGPTVEAATRRDHCAPSARRAWRGARTSRSASSSTSLMSCWSMRVARPKA